MECNLKTDAKYSACRKYRYALCRNWDESKPYAMIIGLNPSTADENENDPTITRCINFAKSWCCLRDQSKSLYLENSINYGTT